MPAPTLNPPSGFPKIRGTFLGVPIIRIVVLGDLYWGLPFLGNCPLDLLMLGIEEVEVGSQHGLMLPLPSRLGNWVVCKELE